MAQQVKYTLESANAAEAARVFHCTWSCRRMFPAPDSTEYSVVDLLVEVKGHDCTSDPDSGAIFNEGQSLARNKYPRICGLLDAILGDETESSTVTVPVKFLLPLSDGYLVRDNIIQDRFIDSMVVSAVHSLAPWEQKTEAVTPEALTSGCLASLMNHGSVALIGHKTQPSTPIAERHQIELELHCRLQMQWWQPELPPTRRLALIRVGMTWRSYQPVWEAARTNRIKLVIIDKPGHWLNQACNSHLYEHFLPLDIDDDHDGQLPARIVELVRKSGLVMDALTSHNDLSILHAAQAAEIMDLPTQASSCYRISRDKYATARLRPEGLLTELVTTEEQALVIANDPKVQYPLVVKPRGGWKSDGVSKIIEPSQVVPSVRTILSELGDLAVVETYIDGPEIDVNIVVCDGELLFSEVADNLPCLGDDNTADASTSLQRPGNFSETGTTSPSGLPQDEMSMATDAAFRSVLAAGFNGGSFHVEGRIINSKMRYERVGGQVDLRTSPAPPNQEAKFVLIEINARPAGLPVALSTKRTYGIDFYEHLFFMALNDSARMHALARPFAFPNLPPGAQYWTHVFFPLVLRPGKFDGPRWESMIASHPKALQHISTYFSMFNDGEEMPDPMTGASRSLAVFMMHVREGRQRLWEVLADVEGQLQPTLTSGLVQGHAY
ncbi:hypothetical protein LTR78_008675 [Recurvomyces mirabilis]|uniref:ATP-grasp domain-containing protein n=1 Tax=Recurvomyces mirabilis TaxID=574656 RepID=A0AAE0WFM0_9PEZI|nr:hypothetical protein LTR78_008675 [Recurvomyces mirabilis]KAK5159240.1 hypothetical protein LTS14_002382 [Recurvomyces mirabilis]